MELETPRRATVVRSGLRFIFACIGIFWSAEVAWAQAAIMEMDHERKLRDLEQVLQTRLAGNAARSRALIERAEQALRVGVGPDAKPRPECDKPSLPADVHVVMAELNSALNTTASRLKEDAQAYDKRLREYDASASSDGRKIEMYFALRAQRMNLLGLGSIGRNVGAIRDSYLHAVVEAAFMVEGTTCLIRDRPGGGTLSASLSAELMSLLSKTTVSCCSSYNIKL